MSGNTINPQTGAVGVPAPKTIRKAREEVYAGISWKWFLIITSWAVVSMVGFLPYFFLSPMFIKIDPVFLDAAKYAIVALEIVWWGIYACNFRTVEMFDFTLLKLSFMWDQYCGLHSIKPYSMKVKFLKMKFPLRDVHKNGLIEFTKNRYGVLISYIPPHINPHDKPIHDINIQKILYRLTGDMELSFISASRHSMRGPILRKVTKKMNEKGTPAHIYKYLHSMYEQMRDKKNLTPQWDFYIFLSLGTCKDLEEAYGRLNEELPGIMDALEGAKMTANVFINPQEIAKQYRQFCIPEKFSSGVGN